MTESIEKLLQNHRAELQQKQAQIHQIDRISEHNANIRRDLIKRCDELNGIIAGIEIAIDMQSKGDE